MSVPLSRFRIGVFVLLAIVLIAILGYRIIGDRSWIDAVYMVVITISSVGFSDQPSTRNDLEKVFTVVVIAFGMSASIYTLGGFIQMLTEGEIQRTLGLRRISREIQALKNHVIICGFGRTGHILAEELREAKVPFVIVDNAAEQVAEAQQLNYLAINGDATEEEVLVLAGIGQAKTLVTALASDAANVFITLTSRNLNSDIQIIARGEFLTTRKKLLQAGANRVVLPAAIGAQRIAAMISRPSIVELLEIFSQRGAVDVEMDELGVPPGSPLVGKTVGKIEARRRHGLLFVAVKRQEGEMLFNPDADLEFKADDTVIVIGRVIDTDRFRKEYGL